MHECLFCGKPMKPGDILFGMRRNDDVDTSNGLGMTSSTAVKTTVSGSSFLGTDDTSDHDESVSVSESEEPEANIELGAWVKDTPHSDFLSKYLYMDMRGVYQPKQIFAVRWSRTECVHKLGLAEGSLPGGVPIKIKLSPEDAQVAGVEYLTQRFCPHCHCEIMNGYMEAEEARIHHIAFVGGSRAGKTQYLTAIYQNLFEIGSLMNDYKMGTVEMDGLSESVMKHLSSVFSGRVDGGRSIERGRQGHIDTTQMAQILPVVMRVTPMDANGSFDSKKRSYIAIYDCPGEIFSANHVNEMVSRLSLRKADALLFMVDAAQLFWALNNYARERDEVRQDTCMLDLLSMIQRFSEYFPENRYKATAFVITKMDQVIDNEVCSLSRSNVRPGAYNKVLQSKDYKDHDRAVNMNVIAQIDNNLRAVLSGDNDDRDSLMTPGIVTLTENNLAGCRQGQLKVFAVSTYTRPADDECFIPCGVANRERHRLLEPLLYLWAELDIIAKDYGEKGPLGEEGGELDDPPRQGFFRRLFGSKDRR